MSELIHCPVCEGWGVISYDQNGVPNPCKRCSGSGQVELPAPIEYALTDCQAAIKAVLDLAKETTNSNNYEARELAEMVVKLLEDYDLIEAEDY